ncbi:MAG: hypothetical protein ACYCXX_07360 [Acidiferrobacter thiooxydans]
MNAPMAEASPALLAVVAEDRVTALLYKVGDGFLMETVVWPAVWGTHSLFRRDLTKDEARTWLSGHGVEEVEV